MAEGHDGKVRRITLDEFMKLAAKADALVPFEAAVRVRAAEPDSADDAELVKSEAEWWLELATFSEFVTIMERSAASTTKDHDDPSNER